MYQYYAVLSTTALILSVDAMRLTRYELSLMQKCNTVDDCVAVNYGYCDCANGGGLYGINKTSVSAFEATFPTQNGCTEMGSEVPCDEGALRCTEERGLCLWESDHAVPPPSCQPSPERPTASPDALTEMELEPFRRCFDDLQCIAMTNKFSCDQNMIGEEIAINSANSKEAFRAAFNQPAPGTCSASNTPYIWRIGTTQCQDGGCVHIPAPLCEESIASDSTSAKAPTSGPTTGTPLVLPTTPNPTSNAIQPTDKPVKVSISAFMMIGAIGGWLLLVV